MCQLKALLFLSLLGLPSLIKAETEEKSSYPPNNIQRLFSKNNPLIPTAASNSAIHNEDVYSSSNYENIRYKRYPKSVSTVSPENERLTGQACNVHIPETTIHPQTTVVEDYTTRTHPSDEYSTTTPFTVTTPFIPPSESTTSFTSPQPINPSTRPTISPPIIKDPTGAGEIQCSFNGLYRANNFTCDQYLVCIYGLTYLMDCPYGLAFNDDKKTCDWPGNVEGCNPRAFENFECPYDISREDNKISTFRYRDSCSQFIACYKRKPRLLSCRDGLSFDEDSKDCVYLKTMTNCKNVIYSF